MQLNIKKNYTDSKIPSRAHNTDAGLDIYVHSYKIVGEQYAENVYRSIDYIEYDSGVSVQPIGHPDYRERYFAYLAPRSSISKYNLLMANSLGVIDAGYLGPIIARMKYIPSPKDLVIINEGVFGISIDHTKIYQVGDKFAQLIVTNQPPVEIIEVDKLEDTSRGIGGFGSSGVK